MQKVVAEYVWYDAHGDLRSKTKVMNGIEIKSISDFPEWNYDGSSTGQAEGRSSDVILNPVAYFKDPFRRTWQNVSAYLVWCDTYNMDRTPHATNNRHKCFVVSEEQKVQEQEPWFGIEQEYILYQLNTDLSHPVLPYKWMGHNLPNFKFPEQAQQKQTSSVICNDGFYPLPSGPFYCGVGADRVFGREIVEQHLEHCIYADIGICGINAEVTCSQWEYQIFGKSALEVSDHLWMSRYILGRVAEIHGAFVEFGVKPMMLWNGSGCHTNFSTKEMREDGGYTKIIEACEKMSSVHTEHLQEYGDETNKLRLTGKHETASYEKFSYGQSDRGSSIRIPYSTHVAQKGYLEDRRPGSNCDPYKVTTRILKTVCL